MTPKTRVEARERLIVALDAETPQLADELIERLGERVAFYKIGWRLFLHGGLDLVAGVRDRGKDVFLDLKMDDIGETIETAVSVIKSRAALLTIMGGAQTVRAAVRGRGEVADPKILSVTFLSSQNEQDLREVFSLTGDVPGEDFLERYILHRAGVVLGAGADGFIASGESVRSIRAKYGPAPLIVTPGVRPAGEGADDHKRSSTPRQAILDGSDYLVVGRPIWKAADPVDATERILAEMDEAFRELG